MMALLHFLLIVSTVNKGHFAPIQEQCNVDSDCLGGYYCSSEMYCDPCITCEKTYNRQPAGLPPNEAFCAKNAEDCGDCMPGFQAEELTLQRRAMKCLQIKHLAVSSNEPLSKSGFPSVLTTFAVFIIVGFLTAMAVVVYKYKIIRHRVERLRTTNRGIELDNITIPSALALPEDQSQSQDGTMETDELMPWIQTRQTVNIQTEDDHVNRATPVGPYHTYEKPSETSRPTAPALEDINIGNTDLSNDDPAESVPAISELNPPANASQSPELPIDDRPVTPIENPWSSDIAVLPPAASGSRNPDGEQSRRRRPRGGITGTRHCIVSEGQAFQTWNRK